MYQPLLNELSRYAAGLITARDLERWLVSELQTVLDSGDGEAIELTNLVDGMLVEYAEGLTTEENLLRCVEAAVRIAETKRLQVAEVSPATEDSATSNTSETITQRVLYRPVEDVRFQASFA